MERTTSAGYRLPIGQTTAPHRHVSRPDVGTQAGGGVRRLGGKEPKFVDEVTFNKIWRENVKNEWKGVYEWKRQYGFMKDFDPRGRPKTPVELPEKESPFAENVPDTGGHEYGSRLNSEQGLKMQDLEFRFMSDRRKCKLDTEFVCF